MQGELTAQQREALRHWLRAAPEHAVALMEMCKLHARLPGVLARASQPVSDIRISQLTGPSTRLH
jgi:ferric-dicitrate binding protein FerR (iron transport regulator)